MYDGTYHGSWGYSASRLRTLNNFSTTANVLAHNQSIIWKWGGAILEYQWHWIILHFIKHWQQIELCLFSKCADKTPTSVTRFGEISPLWQNFKSLDNFKKALSGIWQKNLPTLAQNSYWGNSNSIKCPNIEQIIWPSGHTAQFQCHDAVTCGTQCHKQILA